MNTKLEFNIFNKIHYEKICFLILNIPNILIKLSKQNIGKNKH